MKAFCFLSQPLLVIVIIFDLRYNILQNNEKSEVIQCGSKKKENRIMAVIKVITKNETNIDNKPRVYFTCHPEDFENISKNFVMTFLRPTIARFYILRI